VQQFLVNYSVCYRLLLQNFTSMTAVPTNYDNDFLRTKELEVMDAVNFEKVINNAASPSFKVFIFKSSLSQVYPSKNKII
jgi:hypothetical protein